MSLSFAAATIFMHLRFTSIEVINVKKIVLLLCAAIGLLILSGCDGNFFAGEEPSAGMAYAVPDDTDTAGHDAYVQDIYDQGAYDQDMYDHDGYGGDSTNDDTYNQPYDDYAFNGDPVMRFENFLAALTDRDIAFEYVDTDLNATMLSVVARHIRVGDEIISVYEYESTDALVQDAQGVQPNGFSITRACPDTYGNTIHTEVSWASLPHWFKAGNIIVLYVGENRLILDTLRNILGVHFAGYGHGRVGG